MFFWWGARGGYAQVGSAGLKHCGYCDKDSWFERVVTYRVRHLYWIFRWVTGRELHQICGNCGATHLDDGDVRAPEVTKSIPAFDRRGWLAGVGALGSLVALGSIAAASGNAAKDRYVAQPQVGDVYEADLARLLTKPDAPVMYGALRITALRGDAVEVELPNGYYDDRRGVERDVRERKLDRPGYFVPQHLTMPRTALAKMYADGTAFDVQR